MTLRQLEETVLSVLALMMAGISPNIFPAALAGYANMSYLVTRLLVPSIAILVVLWAASLVRGHARVARRLLVGAVAGIAATVGLEAVRITSFHFGGMPGDLPRLMGVLLTDRLMLGPSPLSDALGWLYHFWNGASFGIIFAVILGRRSSAWAIGFGQLIGIGFLLSPAVKALGIGFMGSDMPTMPLTVVLAHLVYGLILGWLTRRWLQGADWLLAFAEDRHGGVSLPA